MRKILFISIAMVSMYADAKIDVQLSYTKIPEKLATGLDKFDCSGTIGKPGTLSEIGISDADLKKGTHCRKADFDGNGSQDYWFYKCDQHLMSCKSVVLLMDKNQLIKKVLLSRTFENPEILYAKDKIDHDYLTKFGCSRPINDALVEEGDGDGKENRIHILNRDHSDFIESSHCATIESTAD